MHRLFFKVAATFAAMAVVIGAMGAHLLKNVLEPAALESVKTAAYYQMVHSIALIIIGMMYRHYSNKKMIYSGYAFILGILFFSGSIYLMLIFKQMGLDWGNKIGFVTPLGGLLLILGWLLMIIAIPSRTENLRGSES